MNPMMWRCREKKFYRPPHFSNESCMWKKLIDCIYLVTNNPSYRVKTQNGQRKIKRKREKLLKSSLPQGHGIVKLLTWMMRLVRTPDNTYFVRSSVKNIIKKVIPKKAKNPNIPWAFWKVKHTTIFIKPNIGEKKAQTKNNFYNLRKNSHREVINGVINSVVVFFSYFLAKRHSTIIPIIKKGIAYFI